MLLVTPDDFHNASSDETFRAAFKIVDSIQLDNAPTQVLSSVILFAA